MTGTSLIGWLEGPIRSSCVLGRRTAVLVALGAILMGASAARAANDAGSGLAVPRFVSLKSDKVNVREGPTKDHDVAWIYTRAGLPVEITAEFENWRRIRDWEGAEGWVYHSLLSGRRTGLIPPSAKTTDDYISIHAAADAERRHGASLQRACSATSSTATETGAGSRSTVRRLGRAGTLWGVYPNKRSNEMAGGRVGELASVHLALEPHNSRRGRLVAVAAPGAAPRCDRPRSRYPPAVPAFQKKW